MNSRIFLFSFLIISVVGSSFNTNQLKSQKTSYYFSNSGNDQYDGSAARPFKTLAILNLIDLKKADTVFLKGGDVFQGNIILNVSSGTRESPLVITSYGEGLAIINAGNEGAITINGQPYVRIENIICKAAGRKNGNKKNGIEINNCNNIFIDNIQISGFQKSGLQINSCKNVTVNRIFSHDNGAAGIGVEGDFKNKLSTRNIHISNCIAENNPGDPTNLKNHSGNGIVVGHCTKILIDSCVATNNGWDMPRIGNGPVGIWCYEADSVIIQHCISYRNKTSVGAADGGGFDLDGGVTNSIIQYCLSYENQGSGYCIFQYWGASPWYNNVIRFNISENDGLVSDSRAGMYIWNSSRDKNQFYNCDVYNNTIYNSKQAALAFSETSEHKNFRFFNNIFIAKDSLIKGNKEENVFIGNDWWSIEKKFDADGLYDFTTWIIRNNIEQLNGQIKGFNLLPQFKNPDHTTLTDVEELKDFDNYKIIGKSPLTEAGIDLKALFNIDIGNNDFNSKTINKRYLGACTH